MHILTLMTTKNASIVTVCEIKDTKEHVETLWRFIAEGAKTVVVCGGKCTPKSDCYLGWHFGK